MSTANTKGAATPDRWIKCIATHGNIRGVAIRATNLVREMARVHDQRGMGARGLGEAVMGSLLLASYMKQGERVNLNIQGSGYYKQALVDAHPEGNVRGYVIDRSLSKEEVQQLADLGLGPWGSGLLSVLRTKGDEGKQPYIGTVPLLTGHLAKDLTFYWVQSEQINTAVGLAVNLNKDEVSEAGGFMIQALPGASPEEIRAMERHINDLQSLAGQLARDADPLHLLSHIFQSTAFVLLEETPIQFQCSCSWKRVERALALVGAGELRSILEEDQKATVRCDFCGKEYKVDANALERLILQASEK